MIIENELDIRGLFRLLWLGRLCIISVILSFLLLALAYSLLVREEWCSIAVTDRPTVDMLGNFYSQQKFLHDLDIQDNVDGNNDQVFIINKSYEEFILQLSSWDTRRDFFLQSKYYKQRMVGNIKADAALLDMLINNIHFTPSDVPRNVNDSIKLIAETASDASSLLQQYIIFSSKRAAKHLNNELERAWMTRIMQVKKKIKYQEEIAQIAFSRKLHNIKQALIFSKRNIISYEKMNISVNQLSDSNIFLLGTSILQALLKNLQAVGPSFDLDHDKNYAILKVLNAKPVLDPCFQTYRYLRTPENPIRRNSPRRIFLMSMWGIVGAFMGSGVVLVRNSLY